jgi:hypothetical protein
MPELATEHTRAGAQAFAVFFIKTIDWGYATTSSSYIRHYSESECVTCRSLSNGFDKAFRLHHRYMGGRMTVVRSQSTLAQRDAPLVLTIKITPFREIDSRNRVVQADRAHIALRFRVDLVWLEPAWHVREVSVLQ